MAESAKLNILELEVLLLAFLLAGHAHRFTLLGSEPDDPAASSTLVRSHKKI